MSFPVSPLSGVFAAVITPIDDSGNIDFATFDRVVDFVTERGVDGIVIGGATAEYVHFSVKDRSDLVAHAVRRMNGRGKVIAGVGASSIYSALQLARCAEDAGSDLLLISMPYFFRYEQQDLAAYVEAVANSVSAPCLLYNLPSFTNGLEVDTAIRLLESVPNLIGMKDSSGNRANLDLLVQTRKNGTFSLFVGDDDLLLAALQAGWDGVVSGIACFMPELIRALYSSFREGDEDRASSYQNTIDKLIEHIVRLPIPWGVRVGLAARGISNGPMHVPPSSGRLRQIEEFQEWLNRWAAERNFDFNQV